MRPFLPLVLPLVCAIQCALVRAADLQPAASPAAVSPSATIGPNGEATLVAPSAATSKTAVVAPRSAALRLDRAGRPMISTLFNGKGPFDMVVDTGAQSTVITASLAGELQLAPLPGQTIDVVGVSGRSPVSLYPVDELKTDLFSAHYVALPALPNAGSTSARGILGMEYFVQGKLSFNHREGRFVLAESGPAPKGSVALKGYRNEAGLLHVPLLLDGVSIDALVDTGASTTVVNWPAMAALGWSRDDPRLSAGGGIRGATTSATMVQKARIAKVRLGPATLSDVPVVVTPPVAGEQAPQVILGIDLLSLLLGYAVDFPRAELQIAVPQ